ncbi:MAG TPA: LysR family transcriptional regulator [Stellaceae bacterium]|nr:LysR family transcriptional regulator [Stellaceae bacterium]
MDQVSSMSAFVQVVNAGSFTGAARRLEISPTSVTSRVQSFEQQLGVRLLNRTTRKVSLTEEGEAFYERCSRILAELAEVESLAGALQAKPNGTLRLNADIRLAHVIAPLVGEYAALYPEISCELIVAETLGDMVEEKFDLAIFAGPLRDCSLISRRLGVARLALCAAPAYLAVHGSPEHPRDLAARNCLDLVGSLAVSHWRFAGKDGEHAVDVAGNLRSNSIEGLRAGALAGQGICLLPLSCVADDLARGMLVRLLPGYDAAPRIIHALYPSGRHLATRIRSFLDFMIERLRESGPAAPQAARAGEIVTSIERRPSARGFAPSRPAPAHSMDFTGVGALVAGASDRCEAVRMAG